MSPFDPRFPREAVAAAFRAAMGSLTRVDHRLAAAIADTLARPVSSDLGVVTFRIGLEVGLGAKVGIGLACGVAYLRTALQILDDLPVFNGSRLRQDTPCLHIRHGEKIATLAALAFLNRGSTLLWSAMQDGPHPDRLRRARGLIEDCLGLHGWIGGRADEFGKWPERQNLRQVFAVARKKIPSMVRLSVMLPALIGDASEREIMLLDRLALLRGLAHQVADDLEHARRGMHGNRMPSGTWRPSFVAAQGESGAVTLFRRLERMADRVERMLPGESLRWGSVRELRPLSPLELRALGTGGELF
ncbi:MAG: polyprenyl synthetase family protein [Verrucomicrobia bacterium]|nr:polyprenyl synthetase family protein [Verrucomicrobiota bacterium]